VHLRWRWGPDLSLALQTLECSSNPGLGRCRVVKRLSLIIDFFRVTPGLCGEGFRVSFLQHSHLFFNLLFQGFQRSFVKGGGRAGTLCGSSRKPGLLLALKDCQFLFNLSVQLLQRPFTKVAGIVLSSTSITYINGGGNFIFISNRSLVITTFTTLEQLLSKESLQPGFETTFAVARRRLGPDFWSGCVALNGYLLADLLVHLSAFLFIFCMALGNIM
jgi:hypothetical protein